MSGIYGPRRRFGFCPGELWKILHGVFGIRESKFIRHSSFVIRHFDPVSSRPGGPAPTGQAASRRDPPRHPARARLTFSADTFAYANQLTWIYGHDANGKWTSHRREPKPDYTLHCFIVARSTAQFFLTARFDSTSLWRTRTIIGG